MRGAFERETFCFIAVALTTRPTKWPMFISSNVFPYLKTLSESWISKGLLVYVSRAGRER